MAMVPFGFGRGDGIWDPLSAFGNSPFDDIFDFRSFPFARDASQVANTRVDWVETPEAHVFKADLPGFKREEIKIQIVDDKTLSISGKRNKEKVKETDTVRRVERSSGKFSRQFRLPENAKVEEIAAKVENGVLTITLPKTETDPSSVKTIDIA